MYSDIDCGKFIHPLHAPIKIFLTNVNNLTKYHDKPV